jgi:hypothetical protein
VCECFYVLLASSKYTQLLFNVRHNHLINNFLYYIVSVLIVFLCTH